MGEWSSFPHDGPAWLLAVMAVIANARQVALLLRETGLVCVAFRNRRTRHKRVRRRRN
jgi:hypothetical protein